MRLKCRSGEFPLIFLVSGLLILMVLSGCGSNENAALQVAVAANFIAPAERLAKEFEKLHSIKVSIIPGSTGKLYAQIENGAPFDLFLAADVRRPELLDNEGLGVSGTRFTYAIGQLALWSPTRNYVEEAGSVLSSGTYEHLSIANPDLAPYGIAAEQVLRYMGLWDSLESKLVRGENISQALQFVSNGSAQLGFISRSQLPGHGSQWLVPSELHDPIEQQAIIIKATEKLQEAQIFIEYLQGKDARTLIESYGYRTPDS